MRKVDYQVFVYGTLLRGESNHGILGRSKLLGEVRTPPEYELLDLGYFPAMVAGGQTAVAGEIYAVGEATLQRLDRLEGHPHFYTRTIIQLEDGTQVQTYLLPSDQAHGKPRIASGNWRARDPDQGG